MILFKSHMLAIIFFFVIAMPYAHAQTNCNSSEISNLKNEARLVLTSAASLKNPQQLFFALVNDDISLMPFVYKDAESALSKSNILSNKKIYQNTVLAVERELKSSPYFEFTTNSPFMHLIVEDNASNPIARTMYELLNISLDEKFLFWLSKQVDTATFYSIIRAIVFHEASHFVVDWFNEVQLAKNSDVIADNDPLYHILVDEVAIQILGSKRSEFIRSFEKAREYAASIGVRLGDIDSRLTCHRKILNLDSQPKTR